MIAAGVEIVRRERGIQPMGVPFDAMGRVLKHIAGQARLVHLQSRAAHACCPGILARKNYWSYLAKPIHVEDAQRVPQEHAAPSAKCPN